MNISKIMRTELVTIGMDEDLQRAKSLFQRFNFHHLLVVENGRLVGILSDRDLLSAMSPFVGKLSERPQDMSTMNRRVHQIMAHKPITLSVNDSVEIAVQTILERGVSCLPIVDEHNHPLGVVTWRDVLSSMFGIERCYLQAS